MATKRRSTSPGATKKAPAKTFSAKKTAAKKAPAEKATTKKAPTKKATTKKATTKKATTKKAPARDRGLTVEAYLSSLPAPQSEIARRIAAIIEDVAPGASVSIKWGQPVWEAYGPFAYLRGAAEHITFGFWRGAELEDPEGLLEGDGSRMRHLKIPRLGALPEDAIRAFVDHAVRLDETLGSPARRREA